MQNAYTVPIWKKAPFIRLLLPLIAGIVFQWYTRVPLVVIIASLCSFSCAFILFSLLPLSFRFRFRPVQGFMIQLLFMGLGAWLTWQKDIRHDRHWYGNYYRDGCYLIVRIDEPLTEKARSFKATGFVESVAENGKTIPCNGKLLLYFSKGSFNNNLHYGDRIIIHKELQQVKNTGNPGAFNYSRYAAFQGIFHSVFLNEKDWNVLSTPAGKNINRFDQFIYSARAYVLSTLQKTILSGKDELGIAEALLIGYSNDLDKDLVQAYSNTGVVHIIAISGMHLGLIYVLLLWIFARIPFINRSKILQLVLILGCLWLFSLLTGASPSVLRAAVMFSCIAIGKDLKKQVSIYSSMAVSAFILLCYDPYFLWAVGFQLSYGAVLGIVIFQKPLYHCFYFRNRWVDKIWQLMSVSAAAQLLTFPVCIYYFHQFPNLFLVSNIIAVPLSAVILYAAMALVVFSGVPYIGLYLGKLVAGLTWVMNTFICWLNELSFAVWDEIPATLLSTWVLYAVVIAFSAWLIRKNKKYLHAGLYTLLVFVLLQAAYRWQTGTQQKIIVYNLPQHQAIDFVNGNSYLFVGDSIVKQDGLLQNFHIKPGRIKYQLNNRVDPLSGVYRENMFYRYTDKKILIIDRPFTYDLPGQKIELDLVVISKNPKISLKELVEGFHCKQIVADASNPAWQIEKWKKECENLGVKLYAIPEKGAFILNVGI